MLSIIIYITIALLCSALFSGLEIAFISADRLRVELKGNQGEIRGEMLANFFKNPSQFLGTMLVGNNIALVIYGMLMETVLKDTAVGQLDAFPQLLGITIITTLVVLVFGEFLPKLIFRIFSDRILYFFTYPVWLFKIILWPLVLFMVKLSEGLMQIIFRKKFKDSKHVFTRNELEHFIKTIRTKSNDEIDTDLFENALYLPNVKVKSCAIPRTDIKGIDINASIEELKEEFIETGLSKLMVYKGSLEEIVGYVHHLHLLHNPKSIREIMVDIMIVPEVMAVQDVMNKFILEKMSIACVVDEFGGTAGIITLEDILEEIVGEITDEHDEENYIEEEVSTTEFRFSGRLEIDYLNEKYPILDFPTSENNTLSGYITRTTESIPIKGERITLGFHTFIIESVSTTKVEVTRVICNDMPDGNI